MDPQVKNEIIKRLETKYGELDPLVVHRGCVHDYLGMTLDSPQKVKVIVTILDYIEKMLKEIPMDFSGESLMPENSHLFDVNEDAGKLDPERAAEAHHIIAKNISLCKRARPDILLPTVFLGTRVKAPEIYKWKKLRKTMQYLRATKDLLLTLESDDIHVVKCCG